MIAALGAGLLGVLFVSATPPDIAGKWQGEGWGQVALTHTVPGEYTGTYTDTLVKEKEPGKIDVKWSRIEHRYNGTWCEGDDRFGELSIQLVDQATWRAYDRRQVKDQPRHAEAGASGVDAGRSDAEQRGAQTTQWAKSLPNELTVDLGKGVNLEMVMIPAGEFPMGSPELDKDAAGNEKPQHWVRITKPFYFGKFLVTQEQWEAVMGNNPSHFKGLRNPVENVSWDDCQKFLDKLNGKVGGGKFQLPSESQWEYACRAGSKTWYCFGDDRSGLGEYAWYGENSDGKTHPVGEKKPNAWGLYDVHGNVYEWCQDWYDGGYYAKSPMDDPTGSCNRLVPRVSRRWLGLPGAVLPVGVPSHLCEPGVRVPIPGLACLPGCGGQEGTGARNGLRVRCDCLGSSG